MKKTNEQESGKFRGHFIKNAIYFIVKRMNTK